MSAKTARTHRKTPRNRARQSSALAVVAKPQAAQTAGGLPTHEFSATGVRKSALELLADATREIEGLREAVEALFCASPNAGEDYPLEFAECARWIHYIDRDVIAAYGLVEQMAKAVAK